jgi:hypothetical protein
MQQRKRYLAADRFNGEAPPKYERTPGGRNDAATGKKEQRRSTDLGSSPFREQVPALPRNAFFVFAEAPLCLPPPLFAER